MANQLHITVGQYSDKGRKESNQDFHGAYIPKEPQLSSKGVALALADGISSSDVSHIASESAVTTFLEDYYCTSEAWTVKTSVERVLSATNSWLHSQTQQSHGRYDKDRGYVCTFSAMVIKSTTAHIFHVGDTRIYRLHDKALEQLTTDHRVYVAPGQNYLSRAFGINGQVEIDYRNFQVEPGEHYILATDGVYEHVDAQFINTTIKNCGNDLQQAARLIVEQAYQHGSSDNLTVQIARVDELPNPEAREIVRQLSDLPFPPILEARADFDGYKIVREVRGSSRSHIYLAIDNETSETVIIKTLSIDLQSDPAQVERFLMEEWIARRINSPHVLKPCSLTRKRNYIYLVTEHIDGQTLKQWIIDNPKPDLETVRGIIGQVAKGLRAFHRLEMLHQDIRPDNIMIDRTGTVKIIDFGATRIAGIEEITRSVEQNQLVGAALYAAPEYFVGESGTTRSDIFSLGVVAYQMLTGKLPYGVEIPKIKNTMAQKNLQYESALQHNRALPAWVDETIRKAVHPNPDKRYEDVSEFVFDLTHPNQSFLNKARPPLIERNPVAFWKSISFVLFLITILLTIKLTIK
jgi:serine/threonine protein kinase/serine/threonine protein phosphatase PrpC